MIATNRFSTLASDAAQEWKGLDAPTDFIFSRLAVTVLSAVVARSAPDWIPAASDCPTAAPCAFASAVPATIISILMLGMLSHYPLKTAGSPRQGSPAADE